MIKVVRGLVRDYPDICVSGIVNNVCELSTSTVARGHEGALERIWPMTCVRMPRSKLELLHESEPSEHCFLMNVATYMDALKVVHKDSHIVLPPNTNRAIYSRAGYQDYSHWQASFSTLDNTIGQ